MKIRTPTTLIVAFTALIILCSSSFGVVIIDKAAIKTIRPSLEAFSTQDFAVGDKNVRFDAYINKDISGYHYSIKIPSEWRIKKGKRAGSFVIKFPGGSGTVMLMQEPVNCALEAYIVGQEEPALWRKLNGYRHINFDKGNNAYRLVYTFNSNGDDLWEARMYFAKGDRFCLMTLTVLQSDLNDMKMLFDAVVDCFLWEND